MKIKFEDFLKSGQKIKTSRDNSFFTIIEIEENNIKIKLQSGKEHRPLKNNIIDRIEKNNWNSKNNLDPYEIGIAKHIMEKTEQNTTKTNIEQENMNIPLNQILYGPPGTGKTYSTVGKALEILGAEDRKDEIKNIEKLKKAFPNQVEFVTFHQSFSYEDFVEGLKAKSDGESLTYDIENGIFKKICNSARPWSISSFNRVIKKLKQQLINKKSLKFNTIQNDRYFEVTCKNNKLFGIPLEENTQNIPRELSSNSLKEFWLNEEGGRNDKENDIDNKSYILPLIKYIDKEFKDDFKNAPHILIIDEINRGNISRIFGELITLIEPKKRAGSDEEISVQLPYSKTPFSVPNNLYIIGTMNTADRSLTMMDTALRRRFDFVEMLPDSTLPQISTDCAGVNLQKILKIINQRIEVLYDKEHLIGHSFLINVDDFTALKQAFKNKILPLLEEYFYDDFAKIKAVLNDKNNNFYQEVKQDENLFLGMEVEYNKEQKIYNRQNCDELTADDFINIYKNQ